MRAASSCFASSSFSAVTAEQFKAVLTSGHERNGTQSPGVVLAKPGMHLQPRRQSFVQILPFGFPQRSSKQLLLEHRVYISPSPQLSSSPLRFLVGALVSRLLSLIFGVELSGWILMSASTPCCSIVLLFTTPGTLLPYLASNSAWLIGNFCPGFWELPYFASNSAWVNTLVNSVLLFCSPKTFVDAGTKKAAGAHGGVRGLFLREQQTETVLVKHFDPTGH